MTDAKADRDGAGAPVIKVIGVGGGGGNAVQHMINIGLDGAQFCVVNTDRQELARSTAPVKIEIGVKCCGGLGAGGYLAYGRKAAEESYAELKQELAGADLVILVAGLGGRTGGGASPVIAQIARELGIVTVALVTLPFAFEGKSWRLDAKVDMDLLCAQVDALVMIDHNERVASLYDEKDASIINFFNLVNELLSRAVRFAINSWIAKHKLYFASAQAVEAIGCRLQVLLSWARTQGEQAVADAVAQVVHAPWREALSGAPHSRLHVHTICEFTICEFSVKEQDKLIKRAKEQYKLIKRAMRKALGPDIPCQFHGVSVSSELLTKGQVQLTLLAQLGTREQAKKVLEEMIAAGPHFIAGKRS